MQIETFTVGMLSTNCYVAFSQNREAIIIDPGLESNDEADQIADYVNQNSLIVKFIVNTHGHDDHISGDEMLQRKFNVPILIHKFDAGYLEESKEFLAARILEEGSLIDFGDEHLKVMHTPGHTPGSICLIGEKIVFTGDTLFAEGIGRTDFPGGSYAEIERSLKRLKGLPDKLLIYPGHGPVSTIGQEKRFNPFLVSL